MTLYATAILSAIFSDNLIFWSVVSTYGIYRVAAILLTRLDQCCVHDKVQNLLEKAAEIAEEEYDDEEIIDEGDEIKVE